MPTYDYECDACEHRFELFQRITEEPQRKCPSCGKRKLRRLIGTGAAIVFKGSGFYQTDYRSESYKKAAEADRKAVDGGKSEGKSDAKSDSKRDTTSSGGSASPSDGKSSSTNSPASAKKRKPKGDK